MWDFANASFITSSLKRLKPSSEQKYLLNLELSSSSSIFLELCGKKEEEEAVLVFLYFNFFIF